MLDSIVSGGLLMVPIIIASVIALAICIERSWFLRRENVVPHDALLRFQELLQKRDYSEEELRSQAASSLLGWVYFDTRTDRIRKVWGLESDARRARTAALHGNYTWGVLCV